jgi:hypothetical protein
MGETASGGARHREVDADVVQAQAPPDIGPDLHLAPPLTDVHLALCRVCLSCLGKALLSTGKVGHVAPHLFADYRQTSDVSRVDVEGCASQ